MMNVICDNDTAETVDRYGMPVKLSGECIWIGGGSADKEIRGSMSDRAG